MNDTIKASLSSIRKLLYDINRVVYYFRKNNYYKALQNSKMILDRISSLLEVIVSNETYLSSKIIETQSYIKAMFEHMMHSQQTQDYILLADLYELQVIPWLKEMQEMIVTKEPFEFDQDILKANIESMNVKDDVLKKSMLACSMEVTKKQGFEIEYTSTGEYTLRKSVENQSFYFHSNVSPMWEGFLLAESWYNKEKDDYYVYGLGLGYVVLELLKKNEFIKVSVIESDLSVIYLAFAVNDFSDMIKAERLKIIYAPTIREIATYVREVNEQASLVIQAASLKNIQDGAMLELLENYFMQYESVKNQEPMLYGNFNRNFKRNDYPVQELGEKFYNKTVYIIAAGPSLDKNFRLLKEVKNGIIIATGTIFKKLLNAGIKVDYVIITDANEEVYNQIKGFEEMKIPLLYLSTAYYKLAHNYKGMKYIIYQSGFDQAELYAKKKNLMLFQTGGSVVTTALDVSIRLGAKKIVFIGLDLAYSNGFDHAEDTLRITMNTNNNNRITSDIYGNSVQTSKNLSIYKKWIEKRIKTCSGVEFIDATEGGVCIGGTIVMTLKEELGGDE